MTQNQWKWQISDLELLLVATKITSLFNSTTIAFGVLKQTNKHLKLRDSDSERVIKRLILYLKLAYQSKI